MARLVLRQDFGERLVDAELPGDGVRRAARIARKHHDTYTCALERRNRFRRAFLDRIGHRRNACCGAVNRKKHHRLGVSTPGFSALFPAPGIDVALGKKAAATYQHFLAIDFGQHAETVNRLECRSRPRRQAARLGALHDGKPYRVLGKLFHTGHECERFVFRKSFSDKISQCGMAQCQGAGLVHHHGIDIAHAFDGLGIAEQDAGARALSHRYGHRDGRGETDRTRAGDDQNRNCVEKCVTESRLGTEEPPGQRCHNGDGDYDLHEVCRNNIGKPLDRRARALRLSYHVNNTRQQRVCTHALGADHQGAVAVHRCTGYLGASSFDHRHGLAGDHGFVHSASTFEYCAIHRYFIAWLHAQPVADRDSLQRHLLFAAVVAQTPGEVGRELQ